LGFGSKSSVTPVAPWMGFWPRSVITWRADARLSVFRNSSSKIFVISTSFISARAQPSSDLRYPAPFEGFWCIASVIFFSAAAVVTALVAASATGARSVSLLESVVIGLILVCRCTELRPFRVALVAQVSRGVTLSCAYKTARSKVADASYLAAQDHAWG